MSEMIQVPEGWEVIQLSDIGEVITGNTPSTDHEEYYGGSIPFIGPVDFQGQKYITNSEKKVTSAGLLQSRKIPSNSIMTVCIGSTIGKIAISTSESCTNQQVNSLQCSESFNPEFIYYSMNQFLQKQLEVEAGLQAVPIVNKSVFSRLFLLSPISKVEQHRIAEILSTLDRTIEASEKLIAKEKQIKKGLMHDLLTHGIDEMGRIRTPQTHRYKESELGMIPEGWTATSLGTIINNKTKKSDFSNRIPVIDMEHIEQDSGKIIPNSWTEEYPKDKIKFTSGNTLFGKLRPYLKKYWYCDFEGACTSELLVLEAKKNIDQKFAYYLLHIEEFMAHANRFAYGTKMPRVSFSDLKSFTLAIPITSLEQERIADILTAQDKKIETEEANLAKLKELKKGLMDDLLSGSVRV